MHPGPGFKIRAAGVSVATTKSLAGRLALALALLLAPASARAALHVPHQSFTLPNGLQVILHEDHSVPVVTANMWYHVGSGDERPGRTGFAHLFEHIMFMGSQHVPTGQFDQLLEGAGADNNGSTNTDRTNYYEDGPANALPLMVWLDSDRMGWLLPEITPDKVDLQRGVVKNERRQRYENAPYGLAQENIAKRLYPEGHPYHWTTIGSMTDLDAASIEDVRGFFQKYYVPNNATLVIAGDITPAEAKRLVTDAFGDIPRGAEVPRPSAPAFTLPANVVATLEDRVQLPRLYLAWHTVRAFAPDDAALDAVSAILASGKSSRLYRRLVYEMQVASQVSAFHNSQRLDGALQIVATASPGHSLTELQKVIDEEVARLAANPPSQREMERMFNSTEAQFLDGLEHVGGFGGKANQLNFYNYFTGTPDYFEKDLERYRRLTPADVQRAASQYLTGGHRVVLSVVPTGKKDLAVSEEVRP
jgi:zinc protease